MYNKASRSKGPEEVCREAERHIDDKEGLYVFPQLAIHPQKELEAFVTFLKAERVKIFFFNAPFHPVVYKRIISSERYYRVIEAQHYYNTLATNMDIVVLGSYNPAEVNCTEDEFYDGSHPNEVCVEKIFSTVDFS
jgi:hypothetical protein